MKLQKISLTPEQVDINFKFYFYLKEITGTGIKLSEIQIAKLLELINMSDKFEISKQLLEKYCEENIRNEAKKENMLTLLSGIESELHVRLLSFALKLLLAKPLLLEESKLSTLSESILDESVSRLSLEYDTFSKNKPYYVRVNGALLSLYFFQRVENGDSGFMSDATDVFINELIKEYNLLKQSGLEPNQIFMLVFTESVNQSIRSLAGVGYEERITDILIAMGIDRDKITKIHDENDSSTEFDMFFELDGKTYGLGAKRTLRERYKQFIKTGFMSKLDVMVQVTLGIDLTETKAKSIRQHEVYLFVADEVYSSKKYLHEIDGVYPASQFTIQTLKNLK